VDREQCIGTGFLVFTASDVFVDATGGVLVIGSTSLPDERIRDAVEAPVNVLALRKRER
jgi:ferredoxin